jgi:hypothetical protein
MLKKLSQGDLIETSNFGGFSPYWTILNGEVFIADTAREMCAFLPKEKRVVDTIAVCELLQFNYILGNRTMIKNVFRMPWHATLDHKGVINQKPPIPHGNKIVSTDDASNNLIDLLSQELVSVCSGAETIYLLLTGGLDSRVTAGVLKKMESVINKKIICVTWGMKNSRDVQYAKRIANFFKWEFIHLNYDEDLLWENILKGAFWGVAEVSGMHMHAMSWFKNIKKNDLVIAASFGDGIGRAEFSSQHLTKITLQPIINTQHLIHSTLFNKYKKQIELDRSSAWEKESNLATHVINELDMQENYMRRMLCHVMDYIRQFGNLHQAFTSDTVVEYMWSLAPECRVDGIYFDALKKLDGRLYSLPWARTGVAPDGTIEDDTSLIKNYHNWQKWLRKDLQDRLAPLFFSKKLDDLHIFSKLAKNNLWKKWQQEQEADYCRGENIVKIAALELAIREHDLQADTVPIYLKDQIKYILGILISKVFSKIKR